MRRRPYLGKGKLPNGVDPIHALERDGIISCGRARPPPPIRLSASVSRRALHKTTSVRKIWFAATTASCTKT